MPEDILLNFTPQETRVAVLDQGNVQELHIERTIGRGLVGNVYLGKIVRILPGMQSAFIEIGLERTAFLHIADMIEHKFDPEKPIEKLIFEGDRLIVQVIKDPIGSKGARLSTQISIAGRTLVYLPQEKHIGISQRIGNEAERESLKERLQGLIPETETGGYIVRTMAEKASDTDFQNDIAYLKKRWDNILEKAKTHSPPAILYQELSLAYRVLRDFIDDKTGHLYIDSRENFQKLTRFSAEYMPGIYRLLTHYVGERPLFELYGVENEIEKALARRVNLKSGGYLIFDQTEALTTIDVNTGAFVGGHNFDETIFKTNLEASKAIARQLRLRNLGGIILVDFIDMDTTEHQQAVLDALLQAVGNDYTRVTINGFTSLGLVEMTRKRTRESLAHILCEPCPTCAGRGDIKTARTVCYEIMRELLREARQFKAREFRILGAPSVIDIFLDEEAQGLMMLSDFIERPISVKAESSYTQEQYDIVLL